MEKTAVIALSFGKRLRAKRANRANIDIARKAQRTAEKEKAEMILRDPSVSERHLCSMSYILGTHETEIHESTIELIEKAAEEIKRFEITKVFIVTASPYAWRAVRDAKMVLKPYGISVVRADAEGKSFYKDSSQPWTTSPWRWWPREVILRMLPWEIYVWLTKKLA